ncbi:MAG: hypothetical protein H5T60_05395, partial [Anaerolineae bacterium]|nr:hypothetical protein [Anaerolineae bacterium]
MEKPKVYVAHRDVIPGTPGDYGEDAVRVVYDMLKEAIDAVGGLRSFIRDGAKVVVRANVCWAAKPET